RNWLLQHVKSRCHCQRYAPEPGIPQSGSLTTDFYSALDDKNNRRHKMNQTLPSYTSGTSSTPLLGMTIGEMLDRTAARYPDTEALVCLHQYIRWTYNGFVAKVDEAARACVAIGVRRGDRVGIWAPNRYEWTVTQFATAKVGAILVNINPAYG